MYELIPYLHRVNLQVIYLVPKVSNICYEKIIKSGFCAVYVNRLNGYLVAIQAKGLCKNLIIELDNEKCILKYSLIGLGFENWITYIACAYSEWKLRKYWYRSPEDMVRQCQQVADVTFKSGLRSV